MQLLDQTNTTCTKLPSPVPVSVIGIFAFSKVVHSKFPFNIQLNTLKAQDGCTLFKAYNRLVKFIIVLLKILSLLDKFKVTSEHVLIIGNCPLM